MMACCKWDKNAMFHVEQFDLTSTHPKSAPFPLVPRGTQRFPRGPQNLQHSFSNRPPSVSLVLSSTYLHHKLPDARVFHNFFPVLHSRSPLHRGTVARYSFSSWAGY